MFPTRLINRSSLVFSNSCYLLWLTQTWYISFLLIQSTKWSQPASLYWLNPNDIFFPINKWIGLWFILAPQLLLTTVGTTRILLSWPIFQQTNPHNFKKWCTQIWSRYRAPEFTTLVRYLRNLILYKWRLGTDRNSISLFRWNRGSGLVPYLS